MTPPPAFMCDPPTEVHAIPLEGVVGETTFTIDVITPASRHSLYLYQPLLGSESAVLFSLSSAYGIPLVISVMFLFMGGGLALLSLGFRSYNLRGRRLLYPALVALSAGVWQFSENALSVYLTQTPTVLYITAFAGMFLLTIPVIKLTMISLDRTWSPLLLGLEAGLALTSLAAFALQLAGLVQLSQSARLFSVMLPVILTTLAIYSFYTYRHSQTRDVHQRNYTNAVSLLAIGSILEAVNYYLRIVTMISLIFQLFMLAFVVVTVIEAVSFFKRVYRESLQKLELDRNVQMLEQSIDSQKRRNEMLLAHEQEVRRLRHDLRHHYVYISTLVKEKRYDELEDYIGELDSSATALERPPRSYCQNVIANALVSHYADLAAERGYEFSAQLDIPAEMPHLTDGDLCVVLGNLLENAMEACGRIQGPARRIIDFKARVQGPLLFITLDNSLGAAPKRSGSGYATSKTGGSHGIGLQSIQAIAQKYDGEAIFSADEGMFHSSLYLTM